MHDNSIKPIVVYICLPQVQTAESSKNTNTYTEPNSKIRLDATSWYLVALSWGVISAERHRQF
jgi:hypothetical protein